MKKMLIIMLIMLTACSPNMQYAEVLTSGPSTFTHPVWSPDNSEVAGTTINGLRGRFQIYGFSLANKKSHLVLDTASNVSAEAWSPDGRNILFASYSESEFQDGLWLQNLDTKSGPSFLDVGTAGTFSNDGNLLMAYSCTTDLATQQKTASIYTIDLNSGNRQLVYEKRIDCLRSAYLSWSPSGDRLAFSYPYGKVDDYQSDLFILHLSDQALELIDTYSWNPSWGPDGNTMVYIKGGPDNSKKNTVIFLDLQKGCQLEVNMNVGEAAWSPSGKYLAIAYGGKISISSIKPYYDNGLVNSKGCR